MTCWDMREVSFAQYTPLNHANQFPLNGKTGLSSLCTIKGSPVVDDSIQPTPGPASKSPLIMGLVDEDTALYWIKGKKVVDVVEVVKVNVAVTDLA